MSAQIELPCRSEIGLWYDDCCRPSGWKSSPVLVDLGREEWWIGGLVLLERTWWRGMPGACVCFLRGLRCSGSPQCRRRCGRGLFVCRSHRRRRWRLIYRKRALSVVFCHWLSVTRSDKCKLFNKAHLLATKHFFAFWLFVESDQGTFKCIRWGFMHCPWHLARGQTFLERRLPMLHSKWEFSISHGLLLA